MHFCITYYLHVIEIKMLSIYIRKLILWRCLYRNVYVSNYIWKTRHCCEFRFNVCLFNPSVRKFYISTVYARKFIQFHTACPDWIMTKKSLIGLEVHAEKLLWIKTWGCSLMSAILESRALEPHFSTQFQMVLEVSHHHRPGNQYDPWIQVLF